MTHASSHSSPTPNVVIESPRVRKVARTALDLIGVVLGTLIVVDNASVVFDVGGFTVPALAAWSYLRLAFGLAVDNPNTPRA